MARALPARPALAKWATTSRLAERAHRLQRHQLGVAGADADPDQPRGGGSRPLLPRQRVDGGGGDGAAAEPAADGDERARGASAISASFDSAAPTKPTGMPTIAAGRGAPSSSSSSRRKSAVGALPMATTAPASRSTQRSRAAAERVVPSARGKAGDARVVEGADHLVAGGKAGAGDAVGDHLGVAEDRRAGGERRRAPRRRGRGRRRCAARARPCPRRGSCGPRPRPRRG